MLLLVVRSIVVYAATAGVFLWLAHRFVRPLKLGAALALAALPWLFTGPATFTGAIYAPLDIVYDAYPLRALRSEMGIPPLPIPTLGDVVSQEIPWRKAVRAAVKRGELPLWNPHILSGEPLLAVQQPAVFHPGTWIGFLLPLAQAWTFEMSLRLFLALVCGYLFFRDLDLRETPAFIGAAAWAFSNYMVFFLGYPLSPAVAPFPLLLLGLRRLARAPDRRASAIVVASLLLIVTSGHPETLLHVVAAAGLYFLWELFRVPGSQARRAVLLSLGAGVLTLGLSAVLLLPLAEALPHTIEQFMRTTHYAHQGRARPWRDVAARVGFEVSPLGASVGGPRQFNDLISDASGYCGALLLPLALTGFAGRGRDRWFFAGLGLLALSVSAFTPTADLIAQPASLRHRDQRPVDLRDEFLALRPRGARGESAPRGTRDGSLRRGIGAHARRPHVALRSLPEGLGEAGPAGCGRPRPLPDAGRAGARGRGRRHPARARAARQPRGPGSRRALPRAAKARGGLVLSELSLAGLLSTSLRPRQDPARRASPLRRARTHSDSQRRRALRSRGRSRLRGDDVLADVRHVPDVVQAPARLVLPCG